MRSIAGKCGRKEGGREGEESERGEFMKIHMIVFLQVSSE